MILSIVIPSYSREKYLEELLKSIAPQVEDLSNKVEVLVVDNCSTDNTEKMVEPWLRKDWFRYVRHDHNIGLDRNISHAFWSGLGDYVWVIGDDDLVLPRAIQTILEVISRENPAIIYVNGIGFMGEYNLTPHQPSKIVYEILPAQLFVRRANTMLTFISALVINKKNINEISARDSELLFGTWLAQMSWVLPAITSSLPKIYIKTALIGARMNNTGGYNVFEVFADNLTSILTRLWRHEPKLVAEIVNGSLRWFYPKFLATTSNSEERKIIFVKLRSMFGRNFRYWIYIWPQLTNSPLVGRAHAGTSKVLLKASNGFTALLSLTIGKRKFINLKSPQSLYE